MGSIPMSEEQTLFPNKLRYQHSGIAVLIVLFAFALRTWLTYERAFFDSQFFPHSGFDQATYLRQAFGLLDGTWPVNPYYFHPAPAYFFASILSLTGSSLPILYLVIGLVDALTCGLLIASAWLLTQRQWGGYIAGLIYAIYPIAIFYSSSLLITPLASFLIAFFMLLILWQAEKVTWWRTILLGLVAGAIAISRLNLLPMVGLYFLWLYLLRINWQKWILHSFVFLAFMISVIAPFTWHNYQASDGKFIPVATTGSLELYMANNRDSAGRHGRTPALDAINETYLKALIRDIQVAPEHFFGLLTYKFALFWSDSEPANNLNYQRSRNDSNLLQFLPMNFLWLLISGSLGLQALWYRNRQTATLLGLMIVWICFSYVVTFAFGRIRFPAVIPLILLTSFLVISIVETIQHGIDLPKILRSYAPTVITLALLLIFSTWVLNPEPKLPPKRTYVELPDDAILINARFDDVILRGWRVIETQSMANDAWIPIFESYTVELFWQIAEPTETEYLFFIAYLDDGIRYDALDHPIGAVSFPPYTTDKWTSDTIYGEIVSIRLDGDVPQERSGQIRVGVWFWDAEGQIINVFTENGEANVFLQSLAIFNPYQVPAIPDFPTSDFLFGDLIALRGYELPETAVPNETVTLSLYWEALQNIDIDYTLLLHVQDENGEVVAQDDTMPMPNLFSSNWITNYPLVAQLPLTMPEEIGVYEIYAGFYNEIGRLTTNAPDNRVLLGTITVE